MVAIEVVSGALAQQGYKAFKLKVGVAPVEQEAETVRRIRLEPAATD